MLAGRQGFSLWSLNNTLALWKMCFYQGAETPGSVLIQIYEHISKAAEGLLSSERLKTWFSCFYQAERCTCKIVPVKLFPHRTKGETQILHPNGSRRLTPQPWRSGSGAGALLWAHLWHWGISCGAAGAWATLWFRGGDRWSLVAPR